MTSLANQLALLLVTSSLKITAILLAAFVLVRLLRRNSAALRHWVLTLALMATLVLPLLSIISPVWSLAILPGSTAAAGGLIDRTTTFYTPPNKTPDMIKAAVGKQSAAALPSNRSNPGADAPVKIAAPVPTSLNFTPPSASINNAALVLLIWLLGATLLICRWLGQFWLVAGVTRRAVPADADWNRLLEAQAGRLRIRRHVRLVFSAEVHIPMTWGLRQPIIVLPLAAENWDEARGGVVLRHELAHILRRDYLTQWLLLVSCALNWFNPLIWLVMRRITLEREQASDDLVLTSGVRGVEYAAHLLAIARSALAHRPFQMVGLAIAQRSDLEQRIRGILNKSQARAASKRLRLLTLVALVALLLPLGGMRLSPVKAQGDGVSISLAVDTDLAEGLRDQGLLNDFLSAHPGVTVESGQHAEHRGPRR